MDEKYIDELYDYVASQDPTFSNDVDKAQFAQKMQDDAYAKSMYDWISSIDNTFSVDIPFENFKSKVKKKEGAVQVGQDSGLDSSLDSTSLDTQETDQVTLSGFTRGSRYDNIPQGGIEPQPQREEANIPMAGGQLQVDEFALPEFKPYEKLEITRRAYNKDYDQKLREKEITYLANQWDEYKKEENSLKSDVEEFNKNVTSYLNSGVPDATREEELRGIEEELKERERLLNLKGAKAKQTSSELYKKIAQIQSRKEDIGSKTGALWNTLLEGIVDAKEGAVNDLTGFLMYMALRPEDIVKAEGYKDEVINYTKENELYDAIKPLLDSGSKLSIEDLKTVLTENQIDDLFVSLEDKLKKRKKAQNSQVFDQIKDEMVDLYGSGTSNEYIQKWQDESIIGKGLVATAKTLPNLITPGGPKDIRKAFRVAQLYYMGSTILDKTMNDLEAFKDVSENERYLVKAPLGVVVAILEEYGFRNVIKNSGLLNSLLMRVLGKATSNTTAKTLGNLVRDEVDSMVARGLLTVGGAGLAEFETGFLQEGADLIAKNAYNAIKGKDLFQERNEDGELVPLPWITDGEFYNRLLMGGVLEFIGGVAMGSVPAISAAFRRKGFEGYSDKEFEFFETIANLPEIETAFIADLKMKARAGEISPEAAKKQLSDYRKARGLLSKIPTELSTSAKKKALNLLIEKQNLENYIQGKDESLTKKQRNRIQEINQQLEGLSNAVQEQTTNEVPVQPEARTGEEVAQGTPESESEIIAEFEEFEQGKKPKEEVVTAEEEVAEEEVAEEADMDTIEAALQVPSGVYVYEGERGNLTTDGKTVVLETPTKVIEIGNVDEISESTLDDFGLVKEEEMDISVNEDNSVTIKGEQYQNNYSDPLAAISQDKDGNYSVTLDAQNGQKRTFRGQRAQEIVYQYRLKNLEKNAEQEIDEAERLTDEAIAAEAEIESTAPKRKGKGARKAKRKQRTLPTPKAPFNYDKIDSYSEEEIQAEIDKVTKSAQKAPISEISKIRSRIGALQNAIDKKNATPIAPATEVVSKKGMTSEEIETKKKEIAEENRKAKENAGQNIKVKNYKTTKKRGQDLKIGDVYVRRVGDELIVFKVLSELKKYRGQFYTMDVEILHIGNHVNRKEVGPNGVVSEDSIKVGNKFNDQFKNIASASGRINFGEVTVLENFEQPSAPAPATTPTPASQVDKVVEYDTSNPNHDKNMEVLRKVLEKDKITPTAEPKITIDGDQVIIEYMDPEAASEVAEVTIKLKTKKDGGWIAPGAIIEKAPAEKVSSKTPKVEPEARPRRTTEYEELSSIERANAKDTDGKYMPNIYVSDSVSVDLKNFFVFLIESFKSLSDFNVVLLTSADINNDELLKKLKISQRLNEPIESFKERTKEYGFFSRLQDIYINKSLIIYVNDENISISDKAVPTDRLMVLAHEVGHALRNAAFENAPESVKKEIIKEWEKWLATTKGMSTAEVENASRSVLQQLRVIPDELKSNKIKEYFRSFDEWFADRVANYMFTQEKPKSAIDQFFFDIADQFKKLVNLLKRLNPQFNPIENVPKMNEFLDGIFNTDAYAEYLVRSRQQKAQPKPEPKPQPKPKPQPEATEGREFSDAIGTEDLKSIYMEKSRKINTDTTTTPKQKDAAIEQLKKEYEAAKAELTGNNVTTDPKAQEEIDRLESEIERTEIDIENLEEEIQIEQQNTKEEKQRIKEEKAKVRAQKISREQKQDKIEELEAQLEDYIDDQEAIIYGYKDDISYLKKDLRRAKSKLDKIKKPKQINSVKVNKSISINTAMPSGTTISDYIRTGRSYGYSDAKIKEFLKSKGFKAADIKAAMQIFIDPNTPLPSEFNRVDGGYQKAIDMFKDVMTKVSDFALKENSEGEFPSAAEVRRKAIELLSAHPTFQAQDDQTKLQLLIGFDRSLNTKAGVDTNRLMKDIRKSLKDRKAGEKSLRELQVKLKNLVNLAIPKSEYTKGDIARAMALITGITEDNSLVQVDKVMNIVDAAINKNKKALLKSILNLVTQKAKRAITAGGKVRSKGLSKEGQSFFTAIRDIVEAHIAEDQAAIDDINDELDDNETIINEALAKEARNEELTVKEERLLNRALAFGMFANINNKSVEEIAELYNDLKSARAQSIAILKSNRAARAAMGRVIAEDATQKTKELYPFLFNEDGTTKSERDIQRDWDKIWNDLKELKVWSALKQFVEVSKIGEGGFVRQFFVNRLAHSDSLTNILDVKGDFFKKNVYDALNIMENDYNYGIVKQMTMLDEIANTISGIEDGYAGIMKLFNGKIVAYKLSNGKVDQLTDDQAMRIYALSLNDEVKKYLEKMGYDDNVINKIKQDLGSKRVEFVDKVVNYLSNQYYESVNNVYSSMNDVNLGYVENYFPVKRVQSEGLKEALVSGNFSRVFNTEISPAFKERTKTIKEIDLTPTFTGALDAHLHQMERYKAFAVGIKTLSYLFESDAVKMLLNTTGISLPIRYIISNTIAPEAGLAQNPNFKSTFISGLQRKFTSFALAYRLIQIPKQASSFVNAYEDYQYFKGRKVPFLDSIMFAYDMAKVYGNIPKSLKKAQEISPSFRRRLILGIEGDIYGLESGSRVFRKIGKGHRQVDRYIQAFRKGAAYPTVIGDALGVMGYLANYNRNIANGMSPEKAAQAFNDYNATQQSRRGADKIPLQNSQNELSRAFTMFGSVAFLQMNKVYSSSLNIKRALLRGEMPRTKDIRSFALNLGIANVLFVLTANIFKYINGDEEDKKKVEQQLFDALIGLNLIYQIPFIGYAAENLVKKIRGEKMFSTETLNPIMSVASKIDKKYKESEGDIAKSIVPIIELGLGAQIDPAIGVANLFSSDSEIEDDAMFDILGIAPSYRPSKPEPPSQKELMDFMKKYNPDLYESMYGPGSPYYDQKERAKELENRLKGKVKKEKSPLGEGPMGEGPMGKSPLGKSPFQK